MSLVPLVAKTQSNNSNWSNIAISFHWMSIMHNHSLPKEHLATWNRTERTRKAARELNIFCFGLAFQPALRSDICLWPRLDAANGYWLFLGDDFRQINEIFRRFAKNFLAILNIYKAALHFEGGQTQFYIGWREVTIYYMARQLRGAVTRINQSECLITGFQYIY